VQTGVISSRSLKVNGNSIQFDRPLTEMISVSVAQTGQFSGVDTRKFGSPKQGLQFDGKGGSMDNVQSHLTVETFLQYG